MKTIEYIWEDANYKVVVRCQGAHYTSEVYDRDDMKILVNHTFNRKELALQDAFRLAQQYQEKTALMKSGLHG